jgi:acetyl-CoA hydrolase
MLPQNVRYGFLGPVHWAILEACDVTPEGEVILTSSVGAAPTYAQMADKVIVELNRFHPETLWGMHDIYQPADPPNRREIPVYSASDRIGTPYIKIDPSKIAGVVECNIEDQVADFPEPDAITQRIGNQVAEYLASEMRAGRIPDSFLPLQSGVGDTANAVLGALGLHPDIPQFEMYTEVIQDSVAMLLMQERCRFASTCSLTFSSKMLREIYSNLKWFRSRILMRPQEITNHPEVIRRLGLISINTAIEVDLFGNVNSTHVMGKQLMNGIGGSGDFTRNAYLSLFTCPSTAKGGKISTIVPMVSHVDQSEHSVQTIVTEQGVADLRGKDPLQRAHLIIENCAHPDFKDQLFSYLEHIKGGHAPIEIGSAFGMHEQYLKTGSMQGVRW